MVNLQRRRKRHGNSRKGCGNCKLRHVKVCFFWERKCRDSWLMSLQCDEARPGCLKCRDTGLVCNYATDVAEFTSSHEREAPRPSLVCSTNRIVLNHLNNAIASYSDHSASVEKLYQLDLLDLERLSRFQHRTLTESGLMQAGHAFRQESLRLMTTVS